MAVTVLVSWFLSGLALAAAPERCRRALRADREPEDEHPDQLVDPDPPLALNSTGLPGQQVHDGTPG